MNRFDGFKKWAWSIFVVTTLAFALAGCEGDTGPQGAAGADGADGLDGQDGQDGAGTGTTPLESCGVCHSDGSFASAPAAHEVFDVGSFADFAVAPDVADLVVSFSVTVDGALATGATFRRAYFSDGTARTSLSTEINDNPDRFVNNGDGTYSVRIVDGVARFGGTNGRYLVVLLTGANDLEIAAVGDYPAAIPLAGMASNEACIGCHGESGEVGRFAPDNRGGHYSAPIAAEACVVCHRPDDPATPEDDEPSYMQFFRLVHGIHAAHTWPGEEFVSDRDGVYHTTYPTYMSNCSVCHSDDTIVPGPGVSALAAANAMPVTGRNCFSCHGAMVNDYWDFTGLDFHLNYDETTNCEACHTDPANGGIAPATVAEFHNYAGEDANGDPIGIVTARGGLIVNGVDTSVTEGAKFDWQITGVVDDGTNLAITWQASYDGVGVDPCNETIGVGAPTFHASGDGNLSMLRNYAQGDDFILGQSTSAPGQALNVGVSTDNTTCAGNVATTTIPVDLVTAERGIVALQGKPRVVDPVDPALTTRVRAKTPTYEWIVGDGAAPLETRRDIVDTGECLKCHVGSLYQHGGNRVDNVGMCILCHNSASNEKSVRVGIGVDSSEAYDGQVGETFEMKTMLHRIHSAGTPGKAPYVVYRNRGIYGFATDDSLLPNWPGTGAQVVYGSDFATDGTPGDAVINHNFHTPTFPRALNACAACHTPDFAVIPDQAKAMAATTDAGNEACAPGTDCEWDDQLDDTLQGASTTACITCHTDSASKGHAYQNSWTPQVFPEGRQTIIDAAN